MTAFPDQSAACPKEISRDAWLRLIVSSVLGISLADTMIAAALNRLGARLHALADCAYSPAIACVGFLMFGEVLAPWELIGGALAVSGVFVGAAMTPEGKKPRDLWVEFVLAGRAHIIMALSGPFLATLFWVEGFKYLEAG